MKNSELTVGTPVARVIFAQPETVGEKILKHIAHPERNRESMRHPREFGKWNGVTCNGTVRVDETDVPLELTIGKRTQGVEIRQIPGRSQSMKTRREGDIYVVEIGNSTSDSRMADLANKIVATFICHGNGWRNRNGSEFSAPHGADARYSKKRRGGKKKRREWRKRRMV